MELLEYEELESTQIFLVDCIKSGELVAPICVTCKIQSRGIGSRGNVWEKVPNALYFSFAIDRSALPQDLKIESTSIYFGFLCKQELAELGSKAWLKWPNDIYVGDKKIGGVLSTIVKDSLCREVIVCGIGINLHNQPHSSNDSNKNEVGRFCTLEKGASQKIVPREFVKKFCKNVKKKLLWKQIFSLYKLEFQNNLAFNFHHNGVQMSFDGVKLCEDGALELDSQKIYSFR